MNSIYIQSAEQISIQQPLSDAWFDTPVIYDTVYVRAIEPNYKDFLDPNMSRRMGKLLKRAIVTAHVAAKNADIAIPDAIISGTGLGCIENTELFLTAMIHNGEELLQPTQFMQSTHNTIGSLISIDLKCQGYNSTYVHKGTSFENALLDACLQFAEGRIKTALVGGYDEMTPNYQLLLSRIGYWRAHGEGVQLQRGEEAFAGETSVSFMLSAEKTEKTICRLGGVNLSYLPRENELQVVLNDLLNSNGLSINDVDAVMVGISGNRANDDVYYSNARVLFANKPLAGYKHIFGEAYTASGLGMYAAATCLRKKRIPQHLFLDKSMEMDNVKTLLLYNHWEGKNHSLTLLTSCSN
jgi:3-oxoacyl-(acyl-carrier-protein) synthase